jgi:hypothetical protein
MTTFHREIMSKYVLGDAVGGGEDMIVVDERAAAELAVAVHQGSLGTDRGRRHITVKLKRS